MQIFSVAAGMYIFAETPLITFTYQLVINCKSMNNSTFWSRSVCNKVFLNLESLTQCFFFPWQFSVCPWNFSKKCPWKNQKWPWKFFKWKMPLKITKNRKKWPKNVPVKIKKCPWQISKKWCHGHFWVSREKKNIVGDYHFRNYLCTWLFQLFGFKLVIFYKGF